MAKFFVTTLGFLAILAWTPLAQADEADVKYRSALAYKKQGRLDEALALVKQAIKLRKDHAAAYFTMGSILRQQGKLDEALKTFQKVSELQPDHGPAYAMQGAVLLRLNRPQEAVEPLKRALDWQQAHPEGRDPTVISNLGIALRKAGRNEEAISIYKQALEQNPNDPSLLNNLGVAYRNAKKLNLAEQALTKAVELEPNNFEHRLNLAIVLRTQKKYEAAVPHYRAVLGLQPEHPGALFDLGFCLEQLGQAEEAEHTYERYLQAIGSSDPKGKELGEERLAIVRKAKKKTTPRPRKKNVKIVTKP